MLIDVKIIKIQLNIKYHYFVVKHPLNNCTHWIWM